jgi:transposase
MSYDTEHVRNAGDTPRTVTSIPTFTELVENPSLAGLYTALRRSATATAPDLIETTPVSKKTVYDYLHKLEAAGLISKVDTDGEAAVYTAEAFELTVVVRATEVSITPDLIEVIAQKREYPALERVLNDHGIITFALAYDLVTAHSEGTVTIRQIASLTDLSLGTTYDLVEALYAICDLGDNESSPTTYAPTDLDSDEADRFEECADR